MRTLKHPDRWWIAVLVLANLALKCSWSGVNELSGDEPFIVYWAQRPLGALLAMMRAGNDPPVYAVVMHYWSVITPMESAWLRIPSAVFSAITVWPLYLLGRHLGVRSVALTASLLFTFSQHLYDFAHEVGSYSLLLAASTWAIWQLVRLSSGPDRHPSLRPYSIGWLVAANVIAVWTHFAGWILVGLELVMVFSVPLLRPARAKMLAAAGLTLLTMIPLAAGFFPHIISTMAQGTWIAPEVWSGPYRILLRWSNAPEVAVFFLALILVALFRRRASAMAIGLLWCGLPLAGMLLFSVFFPTYIDRYLISASVGFHLVVAQAAQLDLRRKMLQWLLPACCVLAMALTFTPWKDRGTHPSKVAAQVRAWRTEHSAVVVQPARYRLTYAWAVDPQFFRGAAPLDLALAEKGIFPVVGTQTPALDSSIITVVHIDAGTSISDPHSQVMNDLQQRYTLTGAVEPDGKVWVRRFQRK